MALRKLCQFLFTALSVIYITPCHAQTELGQVLEISTHFSSIIGKPSWLLEIREVETGRVLPYIYDVKNEDNYWIAFTTGRSYRVVASTMTFGPYAKIKNFCNLEDGVLSGKSMQIILTGQLTPDTHNFRCRVIKFADTSRNPFNQ